MYFVEMIVDLTPFLIFLLGMGVVGWICGDRYYRFVGGIYMLLYWYIYVEVLN
jgi:hypothetical protein